MNRIFLGLTFLFLSFIVYGFYLSQFQFDLIDESRSQQPLEYYDYKVALNVYSHLSSGSGTPQSIAEEARKVNIKFILLSDTNPFYTLNQDRYFQGLGLLTGKKLDLTDQEKFIVYSSEKTLSANGQSPDDLKKYDLKIILNPKLDENFQKLVLESPLDGIEVINFKSITQISWKESLLSTIWSLIYYPFNPKLALVRLYKDPINELQAFDNLSQMKPLTLFYGAEATARAIPFADWLIRFPSYERSFSIASQHVLLESELRGDITHDSKVVITALKKGRTYVGFDSLGPTEGFLIYALQNKKKFYLGDKIKLTPSTHIYYKLPAEPKSFYEVTLFRNGIKINHLNTFEGLFKITEPGVYRLQVRLSPQLPLPDATKWIPWIYTNNFYIEDTEVRN